MSFFELNETALKSFYFYHMVLTLRHSEEKGIRTGLYTSDMLGYYKTLRGADGNRYAASWWNQRVAGTSYSVEIKEAKTKDGTAHIHMHVFIMAKMPLYNKAKREKSQFILAVQDKWKRITGDSDGVFLEPVYYRNEADEVVYYDRKTSKPADLQKAIGECMKYTLKADSESLKGFGYGFIADLLTTRNRYYGRTGVLNAKCKESKRFKGLDRLCTDFQDLEEITADEWKQLFNPETGETYKKEETAIVVTRFRNMVPRLVGGSMHSSPRGHGTPVGETPIPLTEEKKNAHANRGNEAYYSLKSRASAVFYKPDETKAVATLLAMSIRAPYLPENDLLPLS